MFDFKDAVQPAKLTPEMKHELEYLLSFGDEKERLIEIRNQMYKTAGSYVEEKNRDCALASYAIAAQFETALALSRIAEVLQKTLDK